ncbi:GNAT family N-acetyltransferase [Kiloniella sp. EL199]|uniref:GNAT family N-acetyltransferase n=1 Tax=Kiloniella sp. EL199 TaxID=2107581 RepID=UPI000EA31802|nr:N-acetyltransferase [Kiloniella sp. EL199]
MHIRKEEIKDRAQVLQVIHDAFGQWDECYLVKQLYMDNDVLFGLVAEEEGTILGHILFSTMEITSPHLQIQTASLAPLSVLPAHQGKGIGSQLMERGIQTCRNNEDLSGIIVLGHPAYYSKFGFTSTSTENLDAPFKGNEFMGLEFRKNIFPTDGNVIYAKAFGL